MEDKKLAEKELEQVTGGDKLDGHGKDGKPTYPLWDEASADLIRDQKL